MSRSFHFFALAAISFSLFSGLEAGDNDGLTYEPKVCYEEIFDRTEWEVELIKSIAFKTAVAVAKLPSYSVYLVATTARSANDIMSGLVQYLQAPYLDSIPDKTDIVEALGD